VHKKRQILDAKSCKNLRFEKSLPTLSRRHAQASLVCPFRWKREVEQAFSCEIGLGFRSTRFSSFARNQKASCKKSAPPLGMCLQVYYCIMRAKSRPPANGIFIAT
jgi:hypothetical protein